MENVEKDVTVESTDDLQKLRLGWVVYEEHAVFPDNPEKIKVEKADFGSMVQQYSEFSENEFSANEYHGKEIYYEDENGEGMFCIFGIRGGYIIGDNKGKWVQSLG